MKNGMNIKAYESDCIGMAIQTIIRTGKIVKVNKKSIIVEFNHMTKTIGGKTEIDTDYHGTEKFNFWKNTSDGRALYRSQLDGIIEM